MSILRRLIRVAAVLLAAGCAAIGPAAAQGAQPEEQARFAFVIGNDGYDGAPLATAANDAALVADALKAARFDVTGARNLDQDMLRSAYREYLSKVAAAGPGAVGFVYISGYGLQADGENYLVPPGASVARDADLALNAVRLSDLLRPLAGMPGRARMVALDLAYAGPFAKEGQPLAPGLAMIDPEPGMIVGFNAAPGTWAPPGKEPYGAYAQALGEMLREAGVPVDEMFARVRTRTAELTRAAQVPWNAGRIDPPLALLERKPDAPPPAVTQQQIADQRARPLQDLAVGDAYAAALDRDTVRGYEDFLAAFPTSPYARNVRGILAARREAQTWRRSLAANSPAAYWSYLQRYPNGPHRADARRRLSRLAAAQEPPPAFDPIPYDVAPPPPDETVYFQQPVAEFYDDGTPPPPPSVFIATPPPWYQPPPPPPFADGSDYFLPTPEVAVQTPDWSYAPDYVVAPPLPIGQDGRPFSGLRNPYVAIPAVLAAGIVAGKLTSKFVNGKRPIPGVNTGGPGQQPLNHGQPIKPPFIPAVTAPPKPIMPGTFGGPTGRPQPIQNIVRPGQPAGPPTGQGVLRPGQPAIGQGVAPTGRPIGQPGPQHTLPGQPGGLPATGQGAVRPGQPVTGQGVAPTGRPLGQPGPQHTLPGQPGGLPATGQGVVRPGQPAIGQGVAPTGRPIGQPGPQHALPGQPGGLPATGQGVVRPGQPATGQAIAPTGQPGARPGQQPTFAPPPQPSGGAAAAAAAAQQQRMLQQQRVQQQQQLQQQQRTQQQQQIQQQRAQQQQQQQRVLQQQQQQRALQQQQQQQQRQQQMMQQQRAQQQQQQIMQQQRQQQMIQQQRAQQQQMIQQQQRQQQMLQQQRAQQQMMQQRQQQQQPRRCGAPGLPRC